MLIIGQYYIYSLIDKHSFNSAVLLHSLLVVAEIVAELFLSLNLPFIFSSSLLSYSQ